MAENGQPTLGDVARAAGVSLATASRALNGATQVRADLRERVRVAAERLAYSPNAHARALAKASNAGVGVICHDIGDPYFAGIARGVMRAAARHDLQVILGSTFREPLREISYASMMRGQRVRAMLLIGSGFEDRAVQESLRREVDLYRAAGGRVAVISRHRGLRADAVLPENRAGAADLARALLGLGHRSFAVLSGPLSLTTVVDRLGGFRSALASWGIEVSQVVEGAFTRDGGYEAARELLRRGLAATCVFAATDVMAIGALAAFREAGLRVPEDVSLAGFDDIPMIRDLTPPLTTVALPLEDLGERVMELALLPDRPARARIERVTGRVVLRASTGAPPSGAPHEGHPHQPEPHEGDPHEGPR
ncbi:LacI family transcriptional regulator [Lentzea sp. NBRC 105346]|uniref:LacI family DNA-binding transcriptional regulator n=1 Tax=Lentzea sp. NBRC 105346 TaxID=3032205 RepID=UPI0024A34C56|nr:LacI family DNA-binding transcriptional regulator [Lentzea sp. NBRC 105346]GLZ33747.1 LacI family transcriptional regulator [Lentzea sp. NBRC 105346]